MHNNLRYRHAAINRKFAENYDKKIINSLNINLN